LGRDFTEGRCCDDEASLLSSGVAEKKSQQAESRLAEGVGAASGKHPTITTKKSDLGLAQTGRQNCSGARANVDSLRLASLKTKPHRS